MDCIRLIMTTAKQQIVVTSRTVHQIKQTVQLQGTAAVHIT